MPIYSYRCECGKEFDIKQRISDDSLNVCPDEICTAHGHGPARVERIISKNIGLVFKGSGFYLTDYKKQNTASSVANNVNSADKAVSKSETDSTKQTA